MGNRSTVAPLSLGKSNPGKILEAGNEARNLISKTASTSGSLRSFVGSFQDRLSSASTKILAQPQC